MSHNSSEQTIPPMRRYLDEIIKPVIGVSADRRCWEMLINAKIAEAAAQPTNWSRALTGHRAWPPDCREAFPSEEVFMLLVQKLEHRDYDSFLYKLTKLCDNLQKEHLNNSLITASSDFLKALNTFFSKSTDDAVQLQLLALGVQAVLCFLTETETDQHFWKSKAAAIVQQNNTRRTKGDTASPILVDSLAQTIYKNSCAQYAQLLGSYKGNLINQDLCPGLTTDISSSAQIIGDGGAGKTTYLLIHFRKLLSAYEMDSLNNPIPIYVPLGQYRGMAVNGDRFIQSYIASNYANTPMEQFKLEATRYVLLLDGANESPCADQLGNEIQRLVNLGCQMLITSRYKLEWKCLKTFSCVRINELSDAQIEHALLEKGLPMAEGRLLQTLRRPMWLALYLGIENVDGINTPGEILREHHKWLLSKVAEDVQGPEYTKMFRTALECFPKLSTLTKTTFFNSNEIEGDIEAFLPKSISVNALLDVGVSAGLLKHLGTDVPKGGICYQWTHEYYLDYYWAAYAWSDINECGNKLPTSISERLLPIAVLSFLGDIMEEYCQPRIEHCLKRFAVGRRGNAAQIVCQNLIETMKIARAGHLEKCNFDNLDFSRVNLNGCWISNASFSRTFFSSAFLNAQCTSYLDDMCYLPHRDLLIASNPQNETISFWDYSGANYVGSVALGRGIVSIDISPDEQHLVAVFLDEQITISLYSIEELINCIALGNHRNPPKAQIVHVFPSIVETSSLSQKIHMGPPSFVAFTADSSALLCVYDGGGVARWDLSSEEHMPDIHSIELGEDYDLSNIVLSPSRTSMAICAKTDGNNLLMVYSIEDAETDILYTGTEVVDSVTYTPDDRQIISCFTKHNEGQKPKAYLQVWNNPYITCADEPVSYKQAKLVATGEYIFFSRGYYGSPIEKFSLTLEKISDIGIPCHGILSFKDNELVTFPQQVLSGGNLLVLDAESCKELRTFGIKTYKETKYALSFDVQNAKILRISTYGHVDHYDWHSKSVQRDQQFTRVLRQQSGPTTFARIVGDCFFSVVEHCAMNVWNISDRKLEQSFSGDFRNIKQVGLSDNGGYLIVTKYHTNDILCGDMKNGELKTFPGSCLHDTYYVDTLSATVASGDVGGRVRIWNLIDGTMVIDEQFHDAPIASVAIVPHSSLVISASNASSFCVYDFHKRTFITNWQKSIVEDISQIIPISADRSILQCASGSWPPAYLIGHNNGFGVELEAVPALETEYRYLVSEDKSTFAVYDDIGILRAYSTQNGNVLFEEKLPPDWWKSACISKDGTMLVVANNSGQLLGWDITTGTPLISWNFSNCEDVYGADFKKAINLSQYAKDTLQENGAIV